MIGYSGIAVLIGIAGIIGIALLSIVYSLSEQRVDSEKVSAYECGFSPLEDARQRYDVQYYLVGILFIIFDLEVSYLFPWTIIGLTSIEYMNMIVFLIILTIGFIYEWKKGALEW